MISKWSLILLLALQAHLAASYLVPLDRQAQGEFGGLLRWFWPWSYGDSGPLGRIAAGQNLPTVGLFLALTSAGLLGMAALAAADLWVPTSWCRVLAASGVSALAILLALFFGPTKLIPLVICLGTLYLLATQPTLARMR